MVKKITNFSNVKGKKFRVIANRRGHNYEIGRIYTFTRNQNGGISMNNCAVEYPGGNSLFTDEIELVSCTIPLIQEEIKQIELNAQKEIEKLKAQIAFCEKHKLEEYDEDLEKTIEMVTVIKSKRSDADIAKEVVKIIDSIRNPVRNVEEW